MSFSDALSKTDRLQQLQLLFWRNPGRQLRTREIAERLGVSEDTANRYMNDLSTDGRLPIVRNGWYWQLAPDAHFELLPVKLNLAEGAALYVAGRLLSQIHDERNEHVLRALTKLIAGMPETIALHQHATVEAARERQCGQQDKSEVFEALALGWATHRQVRLIYAPPRLRSYTCLFSPYLLEPSPVGRTMYAIGFSSPPDALRTYKMERIEHAELLENTFDIPQDFDGLALLKKAWGVMYGDEEPIKVHLKFSHWVTKRVKETLWHPSQEIKETPDGCEWTALIGDVVEIANWIRGWGADCEVLAPQQLRDDIAQEARRLAQTYGVSPSSAPQTETDEPDMDFFQKLYGG